MEDPERYIEIFTREFIAGSRVKAVELMGEDDVAALDNAITDFIEGEEEHNPDIVWDFLKDISGDSIKFNNYPIISFANLRAIKDNPDGDLKKTSKRVLEVVSELENIRKKNE